MTSSERRKLIRRDIISASAPISASRLAAVYGVSRQVVVQDVALLRAAGLNVLATPAGYILPHAAAGERVKRVPACRHNDLEKMAEELYTIVDLGGTVEDVIVEHPIYGEYRAALMLATRQDVECFISRVDQSTAAPLSSLTGGAHLHTISAPDGRTLNQIERALREKGILYEE